LTDVFAVANLQGYVDAACTWCEENGAIRLDELCAEDVFPFFEKEIGLRRLEARRLRKAIGDALYTPQPPRFSGIQDEIANHTFVSSDTKPGMDSDFETSSPPILLAGMDFDFEKSTDEGLDENGDDVAASDVASNQSHAGAKYPLLAPRPLQHLTTYDAFEDGPPSSWEGSVSPADLENRSDTPDIGPLRLPIGDMASPAFVHSRVMEMPSNTMLIPMMIPMDCLAMVPMQMAHGCMMYPGMEAYQGVVVNETFVDEAQSKTQMAYGGMTSPSMEALTHSAAYSKPRARVNVVDSLRLASQREGIRWAGDAMKWKSSDREAVSPPFSVKDLMFKIVLKPKAVSILKGKASFKASMNKGYVELRCLTDFYTAPHLENQATLSFHLQIANGNLNISEPLRGPVQHNFADRANCGLPAGQDEWDFSNVLDDSDGTFSIIMEW